MDRWTLSLKEGFSIVDSDGWGRYIGNDGQAFDLDKDRHSDLIQQTMDRGYKGVAAGLGESVGRRSIEI